MSDKRVSEIRARADAATAGPWREVVQDGWRPFVIFRERSEQYGQMDTSILDRIEDAYFIAHARQDVPYLLDELAATQARIKELTAAFEDYGRALRIVLDMADKRAHKRISAYVRDVLGNGHDKARTSEHLTKWERAAASTSQEAADS